MLFPNVFSWTITLFIENDPLKTVSLSVSLWDIRTFKPAEARPLNWEPFKTLSVLTLNTYKNSICVNFFVFAWRSWFPRRFLNRAFDYKEWTKVLRIMGDGSKKSESLPEFVGMTIYYFVQGGDLATSKCG